MNWKSTSRAWLLGAYIGVLGIVAAPRERVYANDIDFREVVRNTDFVSGGVGGMRNSESAALYLNGIKGQVNRAYLYWHGPMNTDFPLANASIRLDGRTVTGVHIGTSDDNCWGFDNSQGYRADVTAEVAVKRNGTYYLSQFVKQGTNINANGASLLVFFDDGITNNNRDVFLFEGNDSNAPNNFDALGWNAVLPGVIYATGTAFLQMHVSDGQIYADDSVILNGVILMGRGSLFQGATVPAANNGPHGFGNLWDIKTWDITSFLTPGTNDFLLTHGYIQHDCISLVVAAFNLPAVPAPPEPPGGTNHAPTVTGTPLITTNSLTPIVVEAEARDIDNDSLDYTIAIDTTIVQTGTVPEGTTETVGRLSVTNTFPLGEHTVVFTVSDGRTNASYTTIVRVIDNTPPTIVVSNLVVRTDAGKTTAVVDYTDTVKITDDFPGEITRISLPAPGGEFPIGVTTVTVTALDASGNRAQETFTITVLDGVPPTLVCPADLVRFNDPGTNNAIVTYDLTVADNLPGATYTCTPPSGSAFPIGTSPVNCVATDTAGNTASCAFNVTINRLPPVNTPPTLTGVTNVVINSNAPIVVTAIAGDADGNALSYSIRVDGVIVDTGTVPAGTPTTLGTLSTTNQFTPGVHLVVFEVNDGLAGATLTTTVRVIDDLPPVIQVPDDIIVQVGPGTNAAIVNFVVTATDNFPGPIQIVVLPPSGSAFPLGTNTVVVTATDVAGNSSSNTFIVVVIRSDNRPPTLTGVANLIVNSSAPIIVTAMAGDQDGDALTYSIRIDGFLLQAGVIPAGTPVTTAPLSVTNGFGLGTHAVVFEVNDGRASASFITTVRVIDNTPPVINVPTNIVVPVDLGMTNAVVNFTATATDDFPGPIQIVVLPPSGSAFNIGTNIVVITATDSSSNSSTATFTVTVYDNVPPTIVCPADLVRFADRGATSAIVTYTVVASDNLPGATVLCLPASGSSFPLGTSRVSCTVTDAATNRASCAFNVTVSPPPDIPTNRPPAVVGQSEIIVHHPNPFVVDALATDDDGDPLIYTIRIDNVVVQTGSIPAGTPQTSGILSVTNAFTLGNHPVVFQVNDGRTNASFTTLVRVIDNTPPDIRVPDTIVVPVDAGRSNALVTFTVTATDDFPGTVTVVVQPPSGSRFPLGTNTVTVTATDISGNRATATFLVVVFDNVPPSITCPPDLIRFNDPGANGAVVQYTVTGSDNLPGWMITCAPPSGSFFPVGTNAVNCVARDAAGNTATCRFNVTIRDQPPIITVPTNAVLVADLGQCSALANYTVTVQDNTPGWSLVCTPPSGSIFPLGVTRVVCLATDTAANTASNSFTITVVDREDPVLHLPADITVNIPTNQSSAVVSYNATATDNCSTPAVVCLPASGSTFPIGTTIVQCTATDASGNVANGSFRVNVVRDGGGGDNEPPVIISITPSKACLWPPNHKMVAVTFTVKATDNSGRPVTAEIISITSNEPENDLGDGNTERDWNITGALKAQLRAERSGLGHDRIYTIVIAVRDAAGNVTTGVTTVCVPHDQRAKDGIMAAAAAEKLSNANKLKAAGKLVPVKPAVKK